MTGVHPKVRAKDLDAPSRSVLERKRGGEEGGGRGGYKGEEEKGGGDIRGRGNKRRSGVSQQPTLTAVLLRTGSTLCPTKCTADKRRLW